MSEWRDIQRGCTHCGGALEARPAPSAAAFVITGAEPMEFRHLATGEKQCTVRFEAKPYSKWGNYKEWQRAGEKTR